MFIPYVFTFSVPCCNVRYDFGIKTMFGSSLPPVGCRRVHFLFMLVVLFIYGGAHHVLSMSNMVGIL